MQSIVNFIIEIDKLKAVTRKTRPIGAPERFENPAEHSWQIALLASAMADYAESPIDIDHVVSMLLVHDLGEIDTGDTMAFVEGGWEDRKAAELAAVQRIFGLLDEPQRSKFLGLWEEFEKGETPEARFANAADRAMPVLLNLANNGQSWRENGITYDRVIKRCEWQIKQGCPALWSFIQQRLDEERDKGWFT